MFEHNMPKMSTAKFLWVFKSHSHVLQKMCPECKKAKLTKGIIDEITLEVPRYFIVTFWPQEGFYGITCKPEQENQLTGFFDDMLKCTKCLKGFKEPEEDKFNSLSQDRNLSD